jgi:PKD repeat protein
MNHHRYFLLVMCAGLLLVGTVSAWYDTDWNYRKEITINNTGSALTDYQVMFTINRSSGSDSGTTVYLDGKCAEDYDDIRFTKADGSTLLDYWIESYDANTTEIWVKVDSIAGIGDTTLYLYYGNPSAVAVSDGDATFPFFDDFTGSSVDTDKWTVTGTPSVSGGQLIINAASHDVVSKTTFGVNYAIRLSAKLVPTSTNYHVHGFSSKTAEDATFCTHHVTANVLNTRSYKTTWQSSNLGTSYTGNRIWDIVRNATNNVLFYIDGNLVATHTTQVPIWGIPTLIGNGDTAPNTHTCDWILVRKYTSTEPTVSAWGDEENILNKRLYPSFSALPTFGYVPLLVSFSDESTAENATVDAWQWSFVDGSTNSTQQNPQHQYTTSGLYDIILTITNTSTSLTNTTKKTGYINVTVNEDAPNADFTVTETCGDIGDTFYFIDFSTGGGLYAWDWSFGDGTANSTLRNPTHQYAANGTYDVTLTVTGAYGTDTLERSNLITVPCGASTPTPTPTATGSPTASGTIPSSEVNETDVGETWIRWVWEDPGEYVDVYLDGIPVLTWLPNTTLDYRLTGLNPNEKHTLGIYRAGTGTLIDSEDATTLPATWFLLSTLGISVLFGIFTLLSKDPFRVLLTSSISCISSTFLTTISIGHSWGISIVAIIVAILTGVVAVLVLIDFRRGDEDE